MAAFKTGRTLSDYNQIVTFNSTSPSGGSTSLATLPFSETNVYVHSSTSRPSKSPSAHEFEILKRQKMVCEYYDRIAYQNHILTSVSRSLEPRSLGSRWPGSELYAQNYWVNSHIKWVPILSDATAKALERIKGDTANLAVDVIEARQTLSLLKDLVSVRRAAARFKKEMLRDKRYKRNADRRAAYLRDQWMSARYGIRPLVGSIFDTLSALLKEHTERRVAVQAISSRKADVRKITGLGTFNDPTYDVRCTTSVRVRVAYTFKLPTGTWISDFTSLNPLGWLWETIPLSFVADWFVTIGSTLENWENWFQFRDKFEGGFYTVTAKETRVYTYFGSDTFPITYWKDLVPPYMEDKLLYRRTQGGTQVTYIWNRRVPVSTLPTPSGPRVKVNLNAAKVLDLCAIISQMLKSVR